MPETPKTSFIPKQTMGAVPGRAPRRRRHFNVFSFIGMVVFLCGLILAVGVFVYKDLSAKELERTKARLTEIKSSFSQGDIEALRELDRRIHVAKALLDQHLSPSVVFDMLESRTQKDTQFTNFSYERRESGSVEITLDGTALRFNTVALQSRQFASAAALKSAIFSELSVEDERGGIGFTVTGQVDTGAIGYRVVPVPSAPAATTTVPSTRGGTSTPRTGTTTPSTQ